MKIYIKLLSYVLIISIIFSSFIVVVINASGKSEDIWDEETHLSSQNIVGQTATGLNINATSVILIEAQTGKTLYEMNSHEKKPPASITKIMTLLLVMEALETGRIDLEDKVTTSEYAANMGGSQIWLEPGESMTVDELLRASIIASANDASVALAEHISGSEESFVALMNHRAGELGMENTVFKNASGLDEDGHYTTAYDIAIMSRELLKFELVTKYSTIWMDTLREGRTALNNTNRLVRFYEGCTGLKTGTTDAAKKCISASATKNGLSLIAVTMGSETSEERFLAARKLLDYGFSNYTFYVPEIQENEIKPLSVTRGKDRKVNVEIKGETGMVVPKGRENDIRKNVDILPSLVAPIEKGFIAGNITFTLDDAVIKEIPIIITDDVQRINFSYAYTALLRLFFSGQKE